MVKNESLPLLICANVSNDFKNELNEASFGQENKLACSYLSMLNAVPSFLKAQKKANTKKNKMNAAYKTNIKKAMLKTIFSLLDFLRPDDFLNLIALLFFSINNSFYYHR